jgi:hypothetical protein
MRVPRPGANKEQIMEAILVLISLVALAVLAPRFGVDSRPSFRGKESELAAQSLSWAELPVRSDRTRSAR